MRSLFLILLTFPLWSGAQNVIYFEDFNGAELDQNVWSFQNGDGCPDLCGWGNGEKQFYTTENLRVEDGMLIIKTTQENDTYLSSRINTKDKLEFQYGTVEVRAMLPQGKGIWPAIWLLGSNIDEVGWPLTGEIDMMEFAGKNPDQIHTTLHTQDSHGNSKNTAFAKAENASTSFHTYKVQWTEDFIKFFIDDTEIYTFQPKDKTEAIWPFDQPFYLILNTAVAGTFAGYEVDDRIFPQEFKIDYIKITQ
jgi:beta-glucanase (GH16 family)